MICNFRDQHTPTFWHRVPDAVAINCILYKLLDTLQYIWLWDAQQIALNRVTNCCCCSCWLMTFTLMDPFNIYTNLTIYTCKRFERNFQGGLIYYTKGNPNHSTRGRCNTHIQPTPMQRPTFFHCLPTWESDSSWQVGYGSIPKLPQMNTSLM